MVGAEAGESTALDASERCPRPIGEIASGMQMVVKGTTKAVILGAESPSRNVGIVSQSPSG